MNPILRDLLDHQYWADAELWCAIGAHAGAREDRAIHDRLHHTHMVQRVFMYGVTQGRTPFVLTKAEDFATFDDLRIYAQGSHAVMRDVIGALTDANLVEPVPVPWFKDPPLTVTVTEALTQCAMHSQQHRAQNATRLRELVGVPPGTDLIKWYWKGRPAARL